PGGFSEKEEIVSDWFPNMEEAKKDALAKAEKEVREYPFSRGGILKLSIEDEAGRITELMNVLKKS
ncbi:hypothetical protein ACJMK2_013768, partial [Sinanodonta woodiana]